MFSIRDYLYTIISYELIELFLGKLDYDKCVSDLKEQNYYYYR